VCLPYAPEADNLPLALIENLHRKDLDPIEKAKGFKRMMDRGLNKLQVGKVLGISDAYVGRMLSMLELPAPVQQLVTTKGIGQEAASHLATGLRQGMPKREATTLARTAAKEKLTGYEVRQEVRKALGDPLPPVRQPSEIFLSLPMSKKPVLDWALMRFGSLAGALEALQALHAPSVAKATKGESGPVAVGSDAVMGTWRDPMGVVRTAARRWPEFLVGMNPGTGGLIAVACGPLPAGFVLCCEVMPNNSVHIAATASGRTRTIGEAIKDSVMGRRIDPSSGKKGGIK
jgi:predicted transcriptional regulator